MDNCDRLGPLDGNADLLHPPNLGDGRLQYARDSPEVDRVNHLLMISFLAEQGCLRSFAHRHSFQPYELSEMVWGLSARSLGARSRYTPGPVDELLAWVCSLYCIKVSLGDLPRTCLTPYLGIDCIGK